VRWQSPPLSQRAELALAWNQAQLWARSPRQEELAREVAIVGIEGWQLLYFRKNSWSNPLSADDVVQAPGGGAAKAEAQAKVLPGGVRLVLQLGAGQSLGATLVSDWAGAAGADSSP
jgi:general secretion pathway protein J